MHDGISFEQYGKPALVVCTHPFHETARNIAGILGIPEYRFARVDHPVGSATHEELVARAEDAYRQGKSILLDK